jgi:hypothetical protein
MRTLTASQSQALLVAAKAINCEPAHLQGVIEFESAWNHFAHNPVSGARGLIQFLNPTARSLGYDNADQLALLHPTAESQLLGPVIRYFKTIDRVFPTLQALSMAVFYPAYRVESESKAFPEAVQRVNPGIVKVGDYMDKVRARIG